MKRLSYFIPVAVFAVLAIYFAVQLLWGRDPRAIPTVLLNQPVPEFALPPIKGRERGFTSEDLKSEVSLVNIFGSWCVSCQVEHPFLMEIAAAGRVPLHGIDWKERNSDDGPDWLSAKGDPYTLIGDDPDSKGVVAFGVTGAPETFVIDVLGIIRHKIVGPMNREMWDRTIWPLIEKLRAEGTGG